MRIFKISILILLFPLGCFAHVLLKNPKGGEVYMAGETITISWEILLEHDQIGWNLYFSSDNGLTWQTISSGMPVSQLNYQWKVPDKQTTMGKIKVVQDNGSGDYEDVSGAFTINTDNKPMEVVTSLENYINQDNESVMIKNYPNPTDDMATFEFEIFTNDYITLAVYDLSGKKIITLVNKEFKKGKYFLHLNTSDIPDGIYLYHFTTKEADETTRLLIVH